jgi:bifunctional DNA-binding transcriptional regulator/antitoxin component of YhaV-PrlF toxin-antitoxin module
MHVMRTVVIRETGELVLPRETLEESHINAGTTLVVIARAGQILLLDRAQVRRRVEEVGQEMQESLGKALRQAGKDAIFAGLSLDEYLGLSEEEEAALWDRLFKEAEQELTIRERDIPPDFVPARQKRR